MSETKDATTAPLPAPKKKPGRPRKKPVREPLARNGVATAPKNEENVIELVYDVPMPFKRAIGVFNLAQAKEVLFIFDTDKIRIAGQDRLQKSDIVVEIDCTKVPHYYCADRLIAPLNAKDLERVIQVIDQTVTIVNVIIKLDEIEPAVHFVFQNEAIKMNKQYSVKIIAPLIVYEFKADAFDISQHAISFELPVKAFKKLVSDAALIMGTGSGKFIMQKVGGGPLTFNYATPDKSISSQCTADDAGIIKLTSRIDSGDVFMTSVQLDHVKPYANMPTEAIAIYIDTARKLALIGAFDNNTITVKVAVAVISSLPVPAV